MNVNLSYNTSVDMEKIAEGVKDALEKTYTNLETIKSMDYHAPKEEHIFTNPYSSNSTVADYDGNLLVNSNPPLVYLGKTFNTTADYVFKIEPKAHTFLFLPEIDKVIFNPPATVVMWSDGTKTVVKTHGEKFSEEHGLAMAVAKRYFGNRSQFLKNVEKAYRPVADEKKVEPKGEGKTKPKKTSKKGE